MRPHALLCAYLQHYIIVNYYCPMCLSHPQTSQWKNKLVSTLIIVLGWRAVVILWASKCVSNLVPLKILSAIQEWYDQFYTVANPLTQGWWPQHYDYYALMLGAAEPFTYRHFCFFLHFLLNILVLALILSCPNAPACLAVCIFTTLYYCKLLLPNVSVTPTNLPVEEQTRIITILCLLQRWNKTNILLQ